MTVQARKRDTDSASLEKGSIAVAEGVVDEKKIAPSQFDFGGDSTLPPPPELSLEEEKQLYRKIDLRLLPILSIMYLCSFLDRGQSSISNIQILADSVSSHRQHWYIDPLKKKLLEALLI